MMRCCSFSLAFISRLQPVGFLSVFRIHYLLKEASYLEQVLSLIVSCKSFSLISPNLKARSWKPTESSAPWRKRWFGMESVSMRSATIFAWRQWPLTNIRLASQGSKIEPRCFVHRVFGDYEHRLRPALKAADDKLAADETWLKAIEDRLAIMLQVKGAMRPLR